MRFRACPRELSAIPDLDAIEAALNPNTEGDAANYLYFCHAADGTAYYATNAADHAVQSAAGGPDGVSL